MVYITFLSIAPYVLLKKPAKALKLWTTHFISKQVLQWLFETKYQGKKKNVRL